MSSDMDVSAFITADSSGLKSGMNDAVEVVKNSNDKMADSSKKLADETKAAAEKGAAAVIKGSEESAASHVRMAAVINASANNMSAGLRSSVDLINGHFGKLSSGFKMIQDHLGLLAGVAAGGAAFKAVIDKTNDWNGSNTKLAKQLGITVTQASDLSVTAKRTGVDLDSVSAASMALAKQVKSGGDAFQKLGVSTKDSSGNMRPVMEIMGEVNSKLAEIHNPLQQNAAGLSVYGLRWKEVRDTLKLTSSQMEAGAEMAKKLGLEISPDQAAKTKEYKEAMREFGLAIDAIQISLGEALLPLFDKLAVGISVLTEDIVSALKPAFEVIGVLVEQVIEVFGSLLNACSQISKEVASGIGAVMHDVFGNTLPNDFNFFQSVIQSLEAIFVGFKVALQLGIQGIVEYVHFMKAEWIAFKAAFQEVFEYMKGELKVAIDWVQMWASAAGKALKLDFSGAKQAVRDGTAQIEKDLSDSAGRMADIARTAGDGMAKEMGGSVDRMKAILLKGFTEMSNTYLGIKPKFETPKAPEKPESSLEHTDFSSKSQSSSKSDLMQKLEAELAAKKLAYEQQSVMEGSFKELSLQQELTFWESKLSTVKKGSDEEKQITAKVIQDKLTIGKQAFQAELEELKTQIAENKNNVQVRSQLVDQYLAKVKKAYGEESAEYKKALKEKVTLQREATDEQIKILDSETNKQIAAIADSQALAKAELDAQRGTDAQQLALDEQFERQKFLIKQQALQKELQLEQQENSPAKMQETYNKLLQLNATYQNQCRLNAVARWKAEHSEMTTALGSVQSGMSQSIQGLMAKTTSLSGALKSFAASIGSAVDQMLAEMAAKWAMTKLTEMALGKTSALSEVGANAATAGSAAWASTAAIPVVGPAMAPAAAASAYTGAMSFAASIPAAAKGFDIPAGINPLTQLHEKEMVLPANIAQPLRDNLAGGGIGGGTNITIHAIDAKSIKKLLRDNGSALTSALKTQKRNFAGT